MSIIVVSTTPRTRDRPSEEFWFPGSRVRFTQAESKMILQQTPDKSISIFVICSPLHSLKDHLALAPTIFFDFFLLDRSFLSICIISPSFGSFHPSHTVSLCTSLRSRHPQNSHPSRSSVFLLLASSVSFTLSRRYSPLGLTPLPHPATSAVRDTPSRMSEGGEMRSLIGFHGNQPASHWHLASLPVEPSPSSHRVARRSFVRTDAVRHADVTPTRNRKEPRRIRLL